MAPEWSAAARPLVLVLIAIAFVVTWIFKADVNAQGGAYATGVTVLITSAAIAVTLAARRARQRTLVWAFGVSSLIFVYTTIDNILERPDGVKIGAFFIGAIIAVSVASRLIRAFELRVTEVRLDPTAELFLRDRAVAAFVSSRTSRIPEIQMSTDRRSSRSSRTTTCRRPAT